ncbi:MAG: hypothetical protein QM482_03860 [Sulfurospirillum sp.]
MILLIPADSKKYENAKIVSFDDRTCWIVLEMDKGYIKKCSFFDDRKQIEDLVDYVIVKSSDEDIEEFLDEGIEVLVAPLQIYAQDVVEAYRFRELHEI